MTACKHSYSALRESTGLDPDFIRRLMRTATALKTNHTAKGERGELLFDDQALSLLCQVAQWRSEKMPFKAITQALTDSLDSILDSNSPVGSEPVDTALMKAEALVDELKQAHQLALSSQQASIARLKQELQILTAAKALALVQQREQQDRLMQLERERAEAERLAQTHAEQLQQEQEEVAKLKANLEKVRCEATNLIKDFQSQKLAARERAAQRSLLLDQLEQLEQFSWVQGGRQRELLAQIRELA